MRNAGGATSSGGGELLFYCLGALVSASPAFLFVEPPALKREFGNDD
jgi:hypothetical protein